MKQLGICLCLLALSLPALAKKAAEDYPTTYKVIFAVRQPGQAFGVIGNCSMWLETEDRIYMVAVTDTFHPCEVFPRGTVLRGREDHRMSDSIELIDGSGSKPKKLRYFVRDVEMR